MKKPVFLKMILAYIPLWMWLVVAGSFILAALYANSIALPDMIINFILCFVFVKLSIIIHEVGHLICGKIAGGKPWRMTLGTSHEITRFRVLGTTILIHSKMNGGFAQVSFDRPKHFRLKRILYTSGGILANLSAAFIVWMLAGFHPKIFTGQSGIDPASAFILVNAFLGLANLLPSKVAYQGISIPSDGLSIWYNIINSPKLPDVELYHSGIMVTRELYEAEKYDEMIELSQQHAFEKKWEVGANINTAIGYLKKAEYERALSLLEEAELLIKTDHDKIYIPLIYANKAWIYLLTGRTDEADIYSQKAVEIAPKSREYYLVRGISHIEKGRLSKAYAYFKELASFDYVNNETLYSAMYLGYIFFLKRDRKKEKKYLNFVHANKNMLSPGQIFFYENILQKIAERRARFSVTTA